MPKKSKVVLSNQLFNILRTTSEIILPALATFYAALGSIWGLVYVVEVVGTITAVAALLGATLAIKRHSYNKEIDESHDGILLIDTADPLEETISVQFDKPLIELENKDVVTFRVNHVGPSLSH